MREPASAPPSPPDYSRGRRASVARLVLLVAVLTSACGAGAGAGDGEAVRGAATSPPAATATPAPSALAETTAAGEFSVFWRDFRRAALAGDGVAVVAMSEVPFHTRGAADDDPLIGRDSAALAALVPRLLAEDPGLRARPTTMRDLLEESLLPPADAVDGDEARVGEFVFARRDGRWRFVRAYLSDP